MLGKFKLTGTVTQTIKDGDDEGLDQDASVLAGWTATLKCNYPPYLPVPDGDDITYIDERTIVLLDDGQISEDGVNPGISLTAHDPTLFDTQLQWTIKPGKVTLDSGRTLRPRAWTFDAPLDGVDTSLGDLTPVVSKDISSVARGPRGYSTRAVPITEGPDAGLYQWVDANDEPVGVPVELSTIITEAVAQAAATTAAEQVVDAIVEADIAGREIAVVDLGDGEVKFTIGGVDLTGTFTPAAAVWSGISDKPAVIAAGSDAESAREAIGFATPYPGLLLCGDSLSMGAGDSGSPKQWEEMATNLGLDYANIGVGGRSTTEIAVRFGALDPTVAAPDDTIGTGTTAVTVEVTPDGVWRGVASWDGYLKNAAGEILAGTLAHGDSALGEMPEFTFTRESSGDEFDATGAVFHCTAADDYLGWVVLFTGGQNNTNINLDPELEVAIRDFDLMSRRAQNRFYIVGLHYIDIDDTGLLYKRRFNERMAARYGDRWIDVGGYMTENGVALAGLTPTAQDVRDIIEGRLITSLGDDNVHPSTAGYTVWRHAVEQRIRETGGAVGALPAPKMTDVVGALMSAPSAGTPTDTTIPITWTALSGAVGYLVEYRITGTTAWVPGPGASGTSATVADPVSGELRPGTSYDIRVVPYNATGRGIPSRTLTASTTGDAPAIITSDSFSTPGAIRNTSTDAALGGSAKTWAGAVGSGTSVDGVLQQDTGHLLATIDTGTPDHRVEVKVVSTAFPAAQAILLRYSDSQNHYLVQVVNATSSVYPGSALGQLTVQKRVANVLTTLDQTQYGVTVVSPGDILEAEIVGDVIRVGVNGRVIIEIEDDSLESGDGCGLRASGLCEWDDFIVYDK